MPRPTTLHYDYVPGQELALLSADTVMWRYHFATDRQKPFLHPLRTTGGILLTAFEPWDHWWHRGHWFSWQFLNGVNYWEEAAGESPDQGVTEFVGPEAVIMAPEAAAVVTHYRYRSTDGEIVMEDRRELSIGLPQPDGHYVMDWRLTFTARKAVTVNRHAITPERDWGGYSGLAWRCARTMGQFRLLNSEGRTDTAVQHERARWVDLTGHADGGHGLVGGVTLMDHPDNVGHPTHWKAFGTEGFGFLNPAPVMMAPISLAENEALTLRYRSLVHDRVLEQDVLEAEYASYAET